MSLSEQFPLLIHNQLSCSLLLGLGLKNCDGSGGVGRQQEEKDDVSKQVRPQPIPIPVGGAEWVCVFGERCGGGGVSGGGGGLDPLRPAYKRAHGGAAGWFTGDQTVCGFLS